MGKYSIRGSPAFDARIDADIKRIADAAQDSPFSRHWKALILSGGYGRGEGSVLVGPDGQERPFDDYRLVVISGSSDPLFRRHLDRMGKELTGELGTPVTFELYPEHSLPKCELSLKNYKLKKGHRIIFGDKSCLRTMQDYPSSSIPLSEGTRLLAVRGKSLLEIKHRLAQPKSLSGEERQDFLKSLFLADLAFGDCALLLRGGYDAYCSVKKQRLPGIDLSGLEDGRAVVSAYSRAVDFMERADFHTMENNNVHLRFTETAARFERFFLWYEQRRLNRKFHSLEKYARTFPRLGQEGSAFANILCNLRIFGPAGLLHGTVHPRLRLYAALPLLLTKHADREDIAWLLRAKETRTEELCSALYALHHKLS